MSRELKIRITGDSSGLKQATDESLDVLSGFSNKVSALSVAAGNLLADGLKAGFRGGVGFLKDSVTAATDINETISKVGVIFGEAAPQIEAFAKNAATQFGQSRQQAMDAAATFAVFGKSAGLAGNDLADFSTDLVALASDMASMGNTEVDVAIQSIGAALRGEAEPIRQFGVLLDDATLRQEALALGLIRTTKDALTPANKVLAAQSAIFKQTKDAQDDFRRTSGGLANQQRILTANINNLKTTIGQGLLPTVLDIVLAINTRVVPVFADLADRWGPKVADALAIVADWFRETGDKVAAVAGKVWEHLQPAIDWIGDNFDEIKEKAELLAPVLASVAASLALFQATSGAATALQAVGAAFPALIGAVSLGPLTLAAVAIGAIVGGLILAYKHSESFRNAVDKLVTSVGNFISDVVAVFRADGLGAAAGYAFGRIAEAAKAALSWLSVWLAGTAIPWLLETGQQLLSRLAVWVAGTALPAVAAEALKLAEKLGVFLFQATEYLRENLPGWLATLVQFMNGTVLPAIVTFAAEMATKMIVWIEDSAREFPILLTAWLSRFSTWWLDEGLPAILRFGVSAAKELGKGFIDSLQWQQEVVNNVVAGLIRGLVQASSKIYDFVKGWVADNVWQPIKDYFRFGSPSKLMQEAGRNIGAGLVIGMRSSVAAVAETANNLAGAAGFTAQGSYDLALAGTSGGPGGYAPANLVVQTFLDGRQIAVAMAPHQRTLERGKR